MDQTIITLSVNGTEITQPVEPRICLADFLRHQLNLTGTHLGCEHGVCGACTVLVDGRAVRGCLMFAVQAHGLEVETVEGLAPDPQQLNPLQRAFMKHHGLQCGFCTPGILMTMTEFLRNNPAPGERDIREVLSGNICRCTGYEGIVAAVIEAAAEMRGEQTESSLLTETNPT